MSPRSGSRGARGCWGTLVATCAARRHTGAVAALLTQAVISRDTRFLSCLFVLGISGVCVLQRCQQPGQGGRVLARTPGSLPLAKGMIPLRLLFQASCLPLTWSWLWITSSGSPCTRRIPRAGEGCTPVTHTLGGGTELSFAAERGGGGTGVKAKG